MQWAHIVRLRLRSLLGRTKVEQELDEELRYHLERQIEENLSAGMNPREAREEALRSFEGWDQRKEECRDMRGWNVVDNTLQDLRFAMRQLRKTPGFTVTAILTLTLGMCSSVAIFAFVDAALLKPLPYRDSSRLVGVYETIESCPLCNLSYFDYLDWKKQNTVFRSLDAYTGNGMMLKTPDGPKRAQAAEVSDGFFRTLGVLPLIGRDFLPGEDRPGAPHTVLLSYATWMNRYGGKSDVLGHAVTLNEQPYVVIGVLRQDFQFAPEATPEFWTPLNSAGSCEQRRSCHNLYGIARLKDGVSVGAARAEVAVIARRLERQYPDSNRGQGGDVSPLSEVIVGSVRPILLVLLAGAVLLLLISCVNIASLLLVRSESRRRELAVRSALGASAGRLVIQFVTEGLVLVAAGSALGLASADWVMHLLTKLIPADMLASMPYLAGFGLNFRVMAFAGSVALLAAGLFSLIPASRLPAMKMSAGLAEGSRGSAGNAWRRLGSKLVMVELATAVVLLVGAGLLGKSFYLLLQVNLGLRPDHLATIMVSAPNAGYDKDELAIALQRQVVSRVGSLPGVESVGLVSQLPVSHNGNTTWFRVLGRPYHGEHNEVPQRDVSSTYFATLGAKLLHGRYFNENEDQSKPHVAMINSAMAKKYFPNEEPLGKQLAHISTNPAPMEIVGVIEDIREGQLDSTTPPVLYVPFNQDPDRYFSMVIRTSQAEESVIRAATATLRQINPDIVASGGAPMSERINDSPSAYVHRSSAWLVGGFAGVALLLSVIGLYGVIAYSVSQRSREIGIRMALGAQRSAVYGLVLKEGGRLALIGIVTGLACSVAGATLIRKLLFGTPPWDLPTLAAVAGVLSIAALLASYIPARRAASVNPVEALQVE
jgi:macrolide transport system ATP-binding/permease protein